ncbi:MAG: helix-turn-helix domain-containing protein [Veillonellales bacterium]
MNKVPQCLCVLGKVRKYGVKALISYIQQNFRKKFILMDGQGTEIFASSEFIKNKDTILQIKKGQWYDEEQKNFVYRAEKGGVSLFLVLHPVVKGDLPNVNSMLEDIRLSMAFYLNTMLEAQVRCSKIENDLMESLFGKKRGKGDDFLLSGHFNLYIDKPYVIQLIHVENTDDPVIINKVIELVVEYTGKIRVPSMRPIYWRNNLVHIIPAYYKNETFELRQEWPDARISEVFRKLAKQKLNVIVSLAMGQIHFLDDLYKSYHEALITLTFCRVRGEAGCVQRFYDLGFFRYIFLQDVKVNKNYVMDKLGAIINYDNENNTNLLQTLNILIDNAFSWKETAARCNVHVNTIHYRVERIEKVLQLKLQDTQNIFELYVALKLWDLLNALELIDDYYVGTIGDVNCHGR